MTSELSGLARDPVPMATSNFLVPNGTFWVELFAFAIIVYILGRYVVPPINKAMTDRPIPDIEELLVGEGAPPA